MRFSIPWREFYERGYVSICARFAPGGYVCCAPRHDATRPGGQANHSYLCEGQMVLGDGVLRCNECGRMAKPEPDPADRRGNE